MPEPIQRAVAILAAVVSLPVVAILAVMVRIDSPGRAFYVSDRVGAMARRFRLIKLRTMRAEAPSQGPGISLHDDARVTRMGRLLRRVRLDEVPQLWNVIRGDMLLVGPRPEDPRYVDLEDPLHRRVFMAKPGITGLTQLAYASETQLLDPEDPEGHYRAVLLPAKVELDARYLANRSASLDLWILAHTVTTVLGRPPSMAAIEARLGRRLG